MIRPAVPSGDGTVEDNGHPDKSIWGESSLHQTRGDPGTIPASATDVFGDRYASGPAVVLDAAGLRRLHALVAAVRAGCSAAGRSR